jgi:NADPH-dependent curcumin reductase CurA
MAAEVNRQWRIAARPRGNVELSDFEYAEVPLPTPGPGQVLLKTHYLSIAPVMRMYMMGAQPTDDARLEIGDVIHGRGVAEVVVSNHPGYQVGDYLHGQIGWQTYKATSITAQERFRKMQPLGLPIHLGLTVLGYSGFSAYCGYFDCGQPQPADTVLVSGAAGGVGHMVVQMAKAAGAGRVIGIAGGPEKLELIKALGCDAAIDYKAEDVAERIGALIPEGIDIYFDGPGASGLRRAGRPVWLHLGVHPPAAFRPDQLHSGARQAGQHDRLLRL